MKHLVLGILAHVDAGKTTLSEGLLYCAGALKAPGRVDHGDAFLDTYSLERERGITIFSKQAVFQLGAQQITLLDTPGHVDFSAEMERCLQVLDYALLVVSAVDGVQGHTETLLQLLQQYRIPFFVFINKMDQPGADAAAVMNQLQRRLSAGCVLMEGLCFPLEHSPEALLESIALCDEAALESYLAGEMPTEALLARLIGESRLVPCFAGAALRLEGCEALLEALSHLLRQPEYQEHFAARVFKISRDEQGTRLTHIKLTGGRLKVRAQLGDGEKVNQIRIYSGARYQLCDEAEAGMVCALTGPEKSYAGQALGAEPQGQSPSLLPVLTYRLLPPPDCDLPPFYARLKQLEEEFPELHLLWRPELGELHAQLMGEVQTEILQHLVSERFGVQLKLGEGHILYKETIAGPVEGVGHFEPLRHYAEVHILMEPGPQGSGVSCASTVSEEALERHWQQLILYYMGRKEHRGVLLGAGLTDVRLTLVAGRAHQKHTEGADFGQAVDRAIRQGLRRIQNVLLEPMYSFTLRLPSEHLGRAMSDIQRFSGSFLPPQTEGEFSVLTGTAPVQKLRAYPSEVTAYTRGRGKIYLEPAGYAPCHNTEEVLAESEYRAETDAEYSGSSIFCAHGAGFSVPYDEVENYMHLPYAWQPERTGEPDAGAEAGDGQRGSHGAGGRNGEGERWRESGHYIGDKELEEIFIRTYGPIRQRRGFDAPPRPLGAKREENLASAREAWQQKHQSLSAQRQQTEYLLVDGYNIIFAWEELKALAEENLDAARTALLEQLSNYRAFTQKRLIAVFDAYKVPGQQEECFDYHGVSVVFTREAQTADQYIERLVHNMNRQYRVTVASSDRLEQMIIWGEGGTLLSAGGLREELDRAQRQLRSEHLSRLRAEKFRMGDLVDFTDEARTGREQTGE